MMSTSTSSITVSLATLRLASLDDATPDTLRRAFAAAIKESHPDRGGNDTMFDEILTAYTYLTSVLKRQSGGRDGLPYVDVEEVQQAREQQWIHELNNSVYDVLNSFSDSSLFQKEFNEQFEKLHVTESKGYTAWLKEGAPTITANVSAIAPVPYQTYVSDLYGDQGDEKETDEKALDHLFHQRFESYAQRTQKEATDIILHPDEMALSSGSLGMALLEKDNPFTSVHERPGYCDLFHAYTSDHVICHKLPVFSETCSTIEERLAEQEKERLRVYEALGDRDQEMIHAYEKKKAAEEAEHKRAITAYFQQTASSQWALRGSA